MYVLLIDNNSTDRATVARLLRSAGLRLELREAADAAAAKVLLTAEPFNCILCNDRLPDGDAMGLLRDVRAAGFRMPFIVLTMQDDQALAVEMMKAGAADCLTKSSALEHLPLAVRNAVRVYKAEMLAADADARLHESEERFRTMADSAPVLLWMADTTDRAAYFNQQWLNFTGRTLAEELNAQPAESVHPEDREQFERVYHSAFHARAKFSLEYRLRRHDGEFRWVLDNAVPRFWPDGSFAGYIGSCIDITDRKHFERELQEAKEGAEAANKAKDQFLAVLSHELRTPLTPVLTTVQALAAEDLPAELHEDVEMIRRNIEFEARLIDDLLDLTRVCRGKLQLHLETIDAHVILRSVLEIVSSDLHHKDLKLSLDLAAKAHYLRADSARLQQIFWNLLKNAIKFTLPGGRITLQSSNQRTEDREILRIGISDTGVGIEPEALPRIFDAFEQGQEAVAGRFGGLGLGLAITRALVDAHDGRLTAHSAGKGSGATFTVEIPVAAAAMTPSAVAPTPNHAAPGTRAAKVRILLVDDHEDTNRAMKRLLQRSGYDVCTAGSVAAALEQARQKPFDLLISDIGLPDGSGLDLMRQLQAERSLTGIALSGFGMEEDLEKSRAAGFVEHLIKPINFQRLEAVIQRLIRLAS